MTDGDGSGADIARHHADGSGGGGTCICGEYESCGVCLAQHRAYRRNRIAEKGTTAVPTLEEVLEVAAEYRYFTMGTLYERRAKFHAVIDRVFTHIATLTVERDAALARIEELGAQDG